MFKTLKINEFRCLENKEINLGRYLTVLSGRNSTGKSTVLGMLGNAGEIKKKEGATYNNSRFRAEFSELFNGSEEHDKSGSNRYEVDICDSDGNIIDYRKFRITWQKKNKNSDERRFHIVPYRKDEEIDTSAKFSIPVLYLGLSRLFPIGEADENRLNSTMVKFKTEEHQKWFTEEYTKILSLHSDIKSVSNTYLGETDKKSAIGVNTDDYDYLANSSGQDNLGQILLAILSFKNIKEDWNGAWKGGLLLIDEIDSTLHPAAQNRLIDLIIREARSMEIQVVVTTHSLSLLKHISLKTAYNSDCINNVELYYFTNANRILEIRRNIDFSQIEGDLLVQSNIQSMHKIKVYSEDGENRWFLTKLLSEYMGYIEVLDVNLGCKELITLYKADTEYFGNTIIVFDGDVKDAELATVPQAIRERTGNMIKLPGQVRPEEVIYQYILGLSAEHPYWASARNVNFTWDYFHDHGPETYNCEKDRDKYKKWFQEHMQFFDATKLFEFWLEDNTEQAEIFVDQFKEAYNSIASRMFINKIYD